MKSYNNLWWKVIDEKNLELAFRNASKGKRSREDVKAALGNIDYHVWLLHNLLKYHLWEPSEHDPVTIIDGMHGKERQIIKPYFMYEQVVHHAIVQVLAPSEKVKKQLPKLNLQNILNRGTYDLCCGSIPGRGIHYGARHIKRWLRDDTKETKYCLKMDIRHFFDSIPHEILIERLSKIIKDRETLDLLLKIISVVHVGIPLGYYTSQWIANWYLQPLDYYIKQEILLDVKQGKKSRYIERMKRKGITNYQIPRYHCGAKYYCRYMDDMVIFSCNKKRTALDERAN